MNRITVFLTDEKILNKRNRNLGSYYGNEDTSPDNNFSETLYNNIYLILPLTIQNQFYLLLRKRHKKYKQNLNKSKFTKITSDNTQGKNVINDSDKTNSTHAINEQVATIKGNSTSVRQYNQRSATSKNQISKPKPGKKDFMLNGIHERGLNKDEHIKVKL